MQIDELQHHNVLPYDGIALLIDNFLSHSSADAVMQELHAQTQWQQKKIVMFGKRVNQPRLMAWQSDKAYTYSGLTLMPNQWTVSLLTLKQQIEAVAKTSFNSALLNLYRNGQDSMGWHQDNESSLGPQPIIASLSLGAARKFKFKHNDNPDCKVDITLKHGSLLIMSGMTQHQWKHCLPKSKVVDHQRINITFRAIKHP